MFLRTPYNYDTMEASNASGLECLDESLAQQHMKDDVDINVILKRFAVTGELPSGVRAPQYGDYEGVTDYHSAMNAVRAAGEAFMKMPADVRSRFNNDAGAFVDFCSNPENRDEAIKLGLIDLPAAPAADPAPKGDGVDQSAT